MSETETRGVAIAKVRCDRFMCCERMPAFNIKTTELYEYTDVFSPEHWRKRG